MRVMLLWLFVVVPVCIFPAAAQNVVEAESTLIVTDKAVEVSLAIENREGSRQEQIELAILDEASNVLTLMSSTVKIERGKKNYKLSIPLGGLQKADSDNLAFYRLRYRVGSVEGLASLSELFGEDFDLRAAMFEHIVPGQPLLVRVRSLNPFTKRPVKGVAVTIDLKLELDTESDDDELKLKAVGKTNKDGFALINVNIPSDIRLASNAEIKITGKKHGVVREIEEDIEDNMNQGSVFLTTDKPLYQPGQMFSVRGLFLNINNTVIPDAEVGFSIEDEDGTVVSRQTRNTSAFGIAAISWQIPDNAKLGNYRVKVEADGDLREDSLVFKITRYDLPNFAVAATPDKSYYLLTDTKAKITVKADYLFGKPVTQGKVRVVRENDREWNYKDQKYDVDEGEAVDGVSDATGKYIAEFDLKAEMAKLRANEWERFRDITFSAYYTDTTTNRTEQRRFDVRLTKEPIHIYLVRNNDNNPALPVTAYVSTFYADGAPAACNVEIDDGNGRLLTKLQTNPMGAGKFEIEVPVAEHNKAARYAIKITAQDKKGLSGRFADEFYLDDDDAIQIKTDRIIYKQGETVEVNLISTQMSGPVYLDVLKEGTSVDSRVVFLRDGKGRASIPYKESFRGDFLLVAYGDKETGRWHDSMRAIGGIIFPEQQNLIFNAKFEKSEYRPAEEGTIKFSVLDGRRQPVEGAIGLGIFDKAIEERARTDREFGGYFGGLSRLIGYDKWFGNTTLKDLNDLDMSRPVSDEMQLVAEIMLSQGWYRPVVHHSEDRQTDARSLYAPGITTQLKTVGDALKTQFEKHGEYATNQQSLEGILTKNGVHLAAMRDPWGSPFQAEFSVLKSQQVVSLKSAGPDKRLGTSDDFVAFSAGFAYFAKTGEILDRAVDRHHARTGGYIRDLATLAAELHGDGVEPEKLRDPLAQAYRITFDVEGRHYTIRVVSPGPDGVFDTPMLSGDDFVLWSTKADYFRKTETEIYRALVESIDNKTIQFPETVDEFTAMLGKKGIDMGSILDGHGRPVYVTAIKESRYSDKTVINNEQTTITPVTEELMIFRIRSRGADPDLESDDVDLATISAAVTEAHRGLGFSRSEVTTVVTSGAKGAIRGYLTDSNGDVIPDVVVTATDEMAASEVYSTTANDSGVFLFSNLPSGRYTINVAAQSGFDSYNRENVIVRSQTLVEIRIELSVGGLSMMVDVSSGAGSLDVTSDRGQTTISTIAKSHVKVDQRQQTSTPRLREYFPESLAWQPELLTDKKGNAEFKFKMADNITTWKMFAIASTKKGKIGVVEKEVTSFQPFFVDLDPPKFLTAGDEIFLPAQIRNYTDRKQRVSMTMDKADWFTFAGGSDKQQVDVEAGASRNAVFGFKTVAPVKGGKQRVTAIGQSDSDSIEKPVTVFPDGQEIVKTGTRVFSGSTTLDVDIPSNALPNSQKAEIKIYPNLFSHVAESVEGLLVRPYGCGEQTISSTYPNVMIMKFVKADTPLRRKAARYLQKGYERLMGYQGSDGGFTYWGGKDSSDVALTAYAMRFLSDAEDHIDVDDDSLARARAWLVRQQNDDGSWSQKHSWERADNSGRTMLITSYVVRSLSKVASPQDAALARGLAYLKKRNNEIDEPFAMALFGLASLDAGDTETAKQIAARLDKIAIVEGGGVYWKLEINTPFNGWGAAGRIETTALVLQLLTKTAKLEPGVATSDAVPKGLVYLLKNKDRYGVWYSTQTTINVLDAFLAMLAADGASRSGSLQITVNGTALDPIAIAPGQIEPVVVDITSRLIVGVNKIDVNGPANAQLMSQTVATHYIDWRDAQVADLGSIGASAMRLDYKCSKTDVAIMEEVTCSVEAERIGHKGYGMLLAEIGTPPGADVSRESLEAALEKDQSLSRYDILPDRIVLYMWSKAGGTNFSFKFRPRYGINAQTPASQMYDYYNPEANAVVRPLRFTVK